MECAKKKRFSGSGVDFESVARWWISENKNSVLNMFSTAVLWVLWTVHNEMCFQGLR
jgi:hypothetical protein